MNRSTTHIWIVVAVLLSPCTWGQQAARNSDTVTVVPEETEELLANPGMGWQTFHHTREQDRNLPDWIP